MSMTDPIADMLTRIRNAMMRRHESVLIPPSRIKSEIARLLKEEGFVRDARMVPHEGRQALKIDLKYLNEEEPVIAGIERVSTPGRRVYVGHDRIPQVKGGYGIAVLSTNRGILSDKQSRRAKVGGELLCYVW
jgi:small subunit ribosomal protein S8